MTSEVGDQAFQGGQGNPSQNGKFTGFDPLFFEKGPTLQNKKNMIMMTTVLITSYDYF